MIRRLFASAAALALLSTAAFAQTQPIPPGFLPVAVATGSISATTTPTSTSISSVPTVWATNQGNVPVCVDWGTTPAPAFPCGSAKKQIGAGETLEFPTLGASSFGAVTQTGTATVSLVEGYVAPAPASSGGGSVVTADQGTPNSVGNAWPVSLVWGGAAVGLTNAIPVQPGTGATFPISAASLTPAGPDISTVATGGIAVNAFSAGHCTKGCYLVNPKAATIDLCVNGVAAASGTVTAGALICVLPGQSIFLPARSGAISVVSSDSAHPFGGEGYQ